MSRRQFDKARDIITEFQDQGSKIAVYVAFVELFNATCSSFKEKEFEKEVRKRTTL